MAHPSIDVGSASDPATAGATLAHLSRHRSRVVRRAVARNPNTPFKTLLAMAPGLPEDVSMNPLLRWLVVEDPDFIQHVPNVVRERLIASAETDSGLIWWAARLGSDDDRRAVLANPRVDRSVLIWIAQNEREPLWPLYMSHSDEEAKDALAFGLVPDWLVAELVVPDSVELRRLIANHPLATAFQLQTLAIDAESDVRTDARAHRNCSSEWVADVIVVETTGVLPAGIDIAVLRSTPYGFGLLASVTNLPDDVAEELRTSADWRLRERMAASPSLSVAAACRLAADLDNDVRAALAANPSCPAGLRRLLANDYDSKVVNAVSGQLGPMSSDVASFLRDMGDPGGALLARDPDLSAEALAALAVSSDWRSRQTCARNINCPPALLVALSSDSDVDVRVAVALNPATPQAQLRAFLYDDMAHVRAAAVTSAVPSDLVRLAADPESLVRIAVANHPDTPTDALATLATDADGDVRAALLVRGAWPDGVLERVLGSLELAATYRSLLAGQWTDRVAVIELGYEIPGLMSQLLDNGLPPLAVVEHLAHANDWRVREATAKLSTCNDVVLAKLMADSDLDVRAAAVANTRNTCEAARHLISDASTKVRVALATRTDVSHDVLARLLLDDDHDVRLAALNSPACPAGIVAAHDALAGGLPVAPEVLNAAVKGPSATRLLVARHPDASSTMLDELVGDDNWVVRQAVAKHPNASLAALSSLAGDHDRDVRREVLLNPASPESLAAALLDDVDAGVRRAAASHALLDPKVRNEAANRMLLRFATKGSEWAKVLAAALPLTGRIELGRRRHWQALNWKQRLGLATNPAVQADILGRLVDDHHPAVRAAARRAAEAPTGAL